MTPNLSDELVSRPVIRNHHDIVLAQVAYSVRDVGMFLGMSKDAVLRLIRSERLRVRHNGRRYIISGKAVLEFLDGADEPMAHSDSARSVCRSR